MRDCIRRRSANPVVGGYGPEKSWPDRLSSTSERPVGRAYHEDMLRAGVWVLRQPRYAALASLMVVVAVISTSAGTWQIARFEQSARDNDALDSNARAAAVPLTTALVPLVKDGSTTDQETIRFRTVTASGTYVAGGAQFVRDESLNGTRGYYVVNPLRTATGVLLVVRGFVAGNVAADGQSHPPTTITAPPSGLVQIAGRLQATTTRNDAAGELSNSVIESINPADQAARLSAPVYDTYITLTADQPGTSGVTVLPGPDLSNPAGGAYEWQHFAYIIQWYLFALLALAAPFAIARHEVREARQRFLGIDPSHEELGTDPASRRQRRSPLTGATSADAVALRTNGALVRQAQPTSERWQRAAQLADRYGRSFGIDHAALGAQASRSGPSGRDRIVDHDNTIPNSYREGVPNSATRPHRSDDAYHGSYNDYLWQLGLADGATPRVSIPRLGESDAPAHGELPNSTPYLDGPAQNASGDLAHQKPSIETEGTTANWRCSDEEID
jgi:cytochrome oxidase assembly protein ShyY1